MQYRSLGNSNLKVSTLCLGTMMFGDQTDAAPAARITSDAHANGVNYIDTADVYTNGASETMVGQLIKAQRHDMVLPSLVASTQSWRCALINCPTMVSDAPFVYTSAVSM